MSGWRRWLEEHRDDAQVARLEKPAAEVLERAGIGDGDLVLDVGTGLGLLASAEVAATPSGLVVGIDRSAEVTAACVERNAGRVLGAAADAEALPFPAETFNVVTTFCVLVYVPDKARAIGELFRVLRPGGRVSLLEPVHQARLRHQPAVPDLESFEPWHSDLVAEQAALLAERGAVLASFNPDGLAGWFVDAGFADVQVRYELSVKQVRASARAHRTALDRSPIPGYPSYKERAEQRLGPVDAERYLDAYSRALAEAPSPLVGATVILSASRVG